MRLLIGALTIGFILSLLALGVFISFRIFAFPDITAEGSITLGAAVAAILLVKGTQSAGGDSRRGASPGWSPGASTGVLHTKFKINGLLSGILVMTALYSINLHVMGRSNVPLLAATTFVTQAEGVGMALLGSAAGNERVWMGSERTRPFRAAILAAGSRHYRSRSLLLLPDGPWHGHARHRRQQPDDPRAGRERRIHDHFRPGRIQRTDRAFRRAAGAVSGIRRRADGNRHGGVGTGQRHHRRGAGRRPPVGLSPLPEP